MEVGKEFASWESFIYYLEHYSKEHKVEYAVGTCTPVEAANKNDSLENKFPTKFKYCFARMLCKHGSNSSNSASLRPQRAILKVFSSCGCFLPED